MELRKSNKVFFLLGFFVFLGFYAAILLFSNVGQLELSRLITIPIRLLVSAAFLILLVLTPKLSLKKHLGMFLAFSCVYILRIGIDWWNNEPLYISYSELFFYYISFAVIPFLSISFIKIKARFFDSIFRGIVWSAIFFTLLAAINLSKYIGTVGRLSSSIIGESVISPLILSYCSALIMGVLIAYLTNNTVKGRQRILLVIILFLSTIPFFLGASRGGLLALVLPFLVLYGRKRGVTSKIKLVIFSIIGISLLILLGQAMGSGVFSRLGSVASDISEADSSAIRIFIWQQSLIQFWNNPIYGDKLAVDGFSGYAHNILIEVLQCTGIIGFVPFMLLLIHTFRISFKIIDYHPQYSWLAIIFLQCFIQAMFSGSIYSSSWLWFSMALILCFPLHKDKNAASANTTRLSELYHEK